MQYAERQPDPDDGTGVPVQEQFRRFLSRHLVTLTCKLERLERGKAVHTGELIVSGFTLQIGKRQFWTTAGHCLKRLDRAIEKGDIRIIESGFADFHGSDAKHFHAYPFTYSPGCGLAIWKDSIGIDFACIPLDPLMVRAFAVNGVVPAGMFNFAEVKMEDFIEFGILGVPECLTKQQTPDAFSFTPSRVRMRLLDIDAIPEANSKNLLAFQIDEECDLESIGGMSGGPVYGLRVVDGQLVYNIIGIQSGWLPEKRVAFVCSLSNIFRLAIEVVAEGEPEAG